MTLDSPSTPIGGGPPSARLVVVEGPLTGAVIHLSGADETIGRDVANTVCLPDLGVSRRHCGLAHVGHAWELRDLGSANGTFVNRIQVRARELVHSDRIAVGESTLLFLDAPIPDGAAGELVDTVEVSDIARLGIDEAPAAPPAGIAAPRAVRGLKALLAVTTALVAVTTESELHRLLQTLVTELAPATETALIQIDESGGMTVTGGGGAADGHRVRVSRTVVRRVIAERVGIITHDGAATAFLSDSLSLTGVRSLLCVPLASAAAAFGAIYLVRSERAAAFDSDDLELVTALGRLAGIAIENVRRLAGLEREAAALRAGMALDHNLVGDSASIRAVYEVLGRVAGTDTTVLLVGETGTGKELAARAIHANSPRARRPFVAVNCAALTESLLESELFGHERGAFTGAVTLKKGKVELAEGGTLFLDEVGELPLLLQSRLLRMLQEREFERLGGTRPIKANIRVISATNRDVAEEVAQKRFRQDLYFRLNVLTIVMPPLRERGSDIPLLARYFLDRHARKAGRHIRGFSPAAMACLTTHDFPGNVRELENVVQRATVLGSTEDILPDDLPDDLVHRHRTASAGPATALDFHAALIATKKRVIGDAFRRAGRSYVEAARILGVHPNYLHRLIRNLEMKAQLDDDLS